MGPVGSGETSRPAGSEEVLLPEGGSSSHHPIQPASGAAAPNIEGLYLVPPKKRIGEVGLVSHYHLDDCNDLYFISPAFSDIIRHLERRVETVMFSCTTTVVLRIQLQLLPPNGLNRRFWFPDFLNATAKAFAFPPLTIISPGELLRRPQSLRLKDVQHGNTASKQGKGLEVSKRNWISDLWLVFVQSLFVQSGSWTWWLPGAAPGDFELQPLSWPQQFLPLTLLDFVSALWKRASTSSLEVRQDCFLHPGIWLPIECHWPQLGPATCSVCL